ncbi:PaaI family thioesterase [Nocardiopsis quinghaiensis]|uniref:PaaI family thioesterase n=1 Tax=Nocardiopsis quinghaiensis TaxID=464995 RepID=UPI001239C503|nr:PaaI family thioesterase [Nocardiopsis quinghaiensis]
MVDNPSTTDPQTDITSSPDQHHDQLVSQLRVFLDRFSSAVLTGAASEELRATLFDLAQGLAEDQAPEERRHYGHLPHLPAAGQATSPWYEVLELTLPDLLVGRAVFGPFFLGGRGAAHGGSIPLLFDELFGRLANAEGMPASRTAYLNTRYHSVVGIGVELTFSAWTDRVEGRKRFMRAELRHGQVLCAEAEALFVTLRPGQA